MFTNRRLFGVRFLCHFVFKRTEQKGTRIWLAKEKKRRYSNKTARVNWFYQESFKKGNKNNQRLNTKRVSLQNIQFHVFFCFLKRLKRSNTPKNYLVTIFKICFHICESCTSSRSILTIKHTEMIGSSNRKKSKEKISSNLVTW